MEVVWHTKLLVCHTNLPLYHTCFTQTGVLSEVWHTVS